MNHNKHLMDTLIAEIGEWSFKKFGRHVSKSRPHDDDCPESLTLVYCGTVLDEVAPLLGMIEQIGELERSPADIRQVVGKTICFIAEYMLRTEMTTEDIDWDALEEPHSSHSSSRENLMLISDLVHFTLCKHRTTSPNEGSIRKECGGLLTALLISLQYAFMRISLSVSSMQEVTDAIFVIASNVWQNIKKGAV